MFGAAVALALSLAGFAAVTARADADTGTGSGADGSLQLIPEVITNSGLTAGGSNDFPVKSELFLPTMDQRVKALEKSDATITQAVGSVSFEPHLNPLFEHDQSATRRSLFAEYTPQGLPSTKVEDATTTTDSWLIVMLVGAVPLTILAVFVGRKTASRRVKRHGRSTH